MSRRDDILRESARYSLRLRVFLAVALAGLSLPLLVFVVSQLERTVPESLWRKTLDATDAVTLDVEAYDRPSEARVVAIAEKYRARIRVVPRVGVEGALDIDRDDPRDAMHPVEAFFFFARSTETSRDYDSATPILARPEVSYALARGLYIDCARDGLRVCRATRPARDRESRAWVVYVDKSSARPVEEVYFVRRILLRLSLVTAPLAMALGFWAARRVTAPIARLRRQALEKASSESPNADLAEHADEVGDLASALNSLLGALARRRAENEAFVADVVHEMKSPVAAITAVAEALEAPVDDARRERLARALGSSAAKLDALVSHFLDLARAEAGMPREDRERVDLADLLRAAVARSAEDPRYSGVQFSAEARGPHVVFGVRRRLDALVRELLDNAASFAGARAEPGLVQVSLTTTHEGGKDVVHLEVHDNGPGIPPEALPRVFQRFFTTRGEKRGTGLGLALVHAVAVAHGGSASAETGEHGATIRVTLPALVGELARTVECPTEAST